MIAGDFVVYLGSSPYHSYKTEHLTLNKTYKVKQSIGNYVYVYLNKNENIFDSARSFRLATEKEIADFQINKMFEDV